MTYACAFCGEENDTFVDPVGGERQVYTEDCAVCCRPNLITVTLHAGGDALLETRRAILPNPWYSITLNAFATRPLKHEIDRSRFGDRERNRLECSRFHGVSDTPDRLVEQRDPGAGHGLLWVSQVVRRSAS